MPTSLRVRAAARVLQLLCCCAVAAVLRAQEPPSPPSARSPAEAVANDDPGAMWPIGSAASSIGAEGGTLRTDDGSLEVEWAPDPERPPTLAELRSRPGDAGVFDAIVVGPSGPVVIRWYPVRVVRSSPPANEPPGRSEPAAQPPEPVVTIEDGNGEWRDVTPQPAPGGGKQVRVGERGRPTRVQLSQGALFRLMTGRSSIRSTRRRTSSSSRTNRRRGRRRRPRRTRLRRSPSAPAPPPATIRRRRQVSPAGDQLPLLVALGKCIASDRCSNDGATGFARWPLQPAARQRSTSSVLVSAVKASTGVSMPRSRHVRMVW